MTGLTLSIDRLIVDTDVEREAASRIPEILRDSFLLLAERWVRSPWARAIPLDVVVREELEVEPVAADELLGERGAERLAERLWRALIDATVEAA